MEEYYMPINLISLEGVRKFKSVRRAIRRGKCHPSGIPIPHRRKHNNHK